MRIWIVYIGSQYKYSCPRFWDVRTSLANPGDFSRSFFRREEWGRREPFISEGKHVTFLKRVAPTKKHDLEGEYRDHPSAKPFLRGPSIEESIIRLPRKKVYMDGIELTGERDDIIQSSHDYLTQAWRLFIAKSLSRISFVLLIPWKCHKDAPLITRSQSRWYLKSISQQQWILSSQKEICILEISILNEVEKIARD